MMDHVSDWHLFDPIDRKTYPQMEAPVQVRFHNGQIEEGDGRMFFPRTKLLPGSSITAWRYIKSSGAR
jgi:hypothetical protein